MAGTAVPGIEVRRNELGARDAAVLAFVMISFHDDWL
jgi:hypothetical protein